MATKTIHCYSDPGHGWAKVPRKLLEQLKITNQITVFSYQRGEFVYLEEDCDLTIFMNAARAAGMDVKLRTVSTCANRQSRIRSYDRYQQEAK